MSSTLEHQERRATQTSPSLDEFAAQAPRSRSAIPEIAVGVLIIAGFGLASLWWFTSATEQTNVLALRAPVERGEVLETDDLVVVSINTDDELATLGETQSGEIAGRVALTDLDAGTVVTASMFAAADALEVGEGVVGVELDAGDVPTRALLPGNIVSVILTPEPGSVDNPGTGRADGWSEVLVDNAVVVESSPVGNQGRQFVALSMTEQQAQIVAGAASQERVRLIQVTREN